MIKKNFLHGMLVIAWIFRITLVGLCVMTVKKAASMLKAKIYTLPMGE